MTGQDNPFTGTSKCVYSGTGQIESLGEIKNGKRDGQWTWWYENGQMWYERNYTNDKREGKSTEWYEDGTIKKVAYYENGGLVN